MVKSFNSLELYLSCLNPYPDQRPTTLELYNTIISIIGERYDFKNETQILRQYDIVTATLQIPQMKFLR